LGDGESLRETFIGDNSSPFFNGDLNLLSPSINYNFSSYFNPKILGGGEAVSGEFISRFSIEGQNVCFLFGLARIRPRLLYAA